MVLGAGVLRVSLFSDISLRYVKESLQPYVAAAGTVLLVAGFIGALHDRSLRAATTATDGTGQVVPSEHGHDHSHGSRVGWLLLPPALALLLFAPPALGAYTAARDTPLIVEEYERFEPLAVEGPVPLSLTEFIARVQQDETGSLEGRTVVMQGFVTPRKDGGWDLTRLVVACCAADSQSLAVTVRGAPAPPADTWVKVTGTWHPRGAFGTRSAALALDTARVERIAQPANPYTDRAPTVSP
ncbi:TIGR03943 family putative permease subunit [Streptomyces sp. NPDC002835]